MNTRIIAIFQAAVMAALISVAVSAGDYGGDTLTNSDIIGYVRTNVSPMLIIARINTSNTAFDLSENGVVTLKESGVPDEVLSVMMVAANRSSGLAGGRVPAIRSMPAVNPPPPLSGSANTPPPRAEAPSTGDSSRFARELAVLANGTPDAQKSAMAWMLANREQSLPLLRQALGDSRPETQAAVLYALGGLKDRESLIPMRRLLASPSPLVRERAALALAEAGDTEAITASESLLRKPVEPMDGYIRLVGAARLVRASADLGRILSTDVSPLNRTAAAWALAEIGRGGAAARPILEKALVDDSEPSVRREAARAVAAFHDAASAKLLRDVCRKDPEVRKAILLAMGEYPGMVEFLITVMNLGADQITADEREAARTSLHTLTGQDFALDSARWNRWFEENRARFTVPDHSVITDSSPESARNDSGGSAHAGSGAGSARMTDVTALGVLTDSTQIPMAPELDARPGAGGDMRSMLEGPSVPFALSPHDFSAGAETGAPGLPPGLQGSGDAAASGLPLRTWSSDSNRTVGGDAASGRKKDAGTEDAASGADVFGPLPKTADLPREADPYAYSFQEIPAEPSALPAAPVVTLQPASSTPSGGGLGGISLPLPPIGGMPDAVATPLESGVSPTPTLAEAAPTETPDGSLPDAAAASTMDVLADYGPPVGESDAGAFDFGALPFDGGEASYDDFFGDIELAVPKTDVIPEKGTGSLRPDAFTDSLSGMDDGPGVQETSVAQTDSPTVADGAGEERAELDDYAIIAFPDDGFGLGESYFDVNGTDAAAEDDDVNAFLRGMVMPLPPAADGETASSDPEAPDLTAAAPDGDEAHADGGSLEVPDSPPETLFVMPQPGQLVEGENFFEDGELLDNASFSHESLADDDSLLPIDGVLSTDVLPSSSPAASLAGEATASSADDGDATTDGGVATANQPPDGEEPIISELWDGPEEFYHTLDDLEGHDFEILGETGEEQASKFLSPDSSESEKDAKDASPVSGSGAPPSSSTPAGSLPPEPTYVEPPEIPSERPAAPLAAHDGRGPDSPAEGTADIVRSLGNGTLQPALLGEETLPGAPSEKTRPERRTPRWKR